MGLIQGLAARAARATVLAGRAATGLQKSLGSAWDEGIGQAKEAQRKIALEHRAAVLGIPAPWYEAAAATYGEAELMAAALAKGNDGPEPSMRAQALNWRALVEDPFEPLASWGGYRERAAVISYEMLEQLARRVGPYTAYLQTRLNQVSRSGCVQKDNRGQGWVVRPKKGKEHLEGSKEQEKIQKIIQDCGSIDRYDPETGEVRDGFLTFLRKITRDTLIHDQINVDKRRDVKGRLIAWRAIDPKTIRSVSRESRAANDFGEPIRYVQVVNGTIVADFSRKDLIFHVRNPRSDIRTYGYGFSELEMMVDTITGLLNGFTHNSNFFSHGTTAKGVLAIHGAVPPNKMRTFKHIWYAMVTGAQNAWRTPLLNLPDEKSKVEWIDLQKSNLDMEWASFMEWCLKNMCGVLQISSEEIGWQFGNTGQTGGLQEGNQIAKIEASKDRGLPTLFQNLSTMVNDEIVAELTEDFEFAFVGLDNTTEAAENDLLVKEVENWKMVDEVRKAKGMKPLPDKKGQVILNSNWLNWVQQQAQAQQAQQQGGGMPGAPGMPPGPPGPGQPDGGEDQGAGPPDGAAPPGPPSPPGAAPGGAPDGGGPEAAASPLGPGAFPTGFAKSRAGVVRRKGTVTRYEIEL